ncbi:uncharacterized protein VNE69_09156 [Vairimorpha necatrix]|uniref:Uncharacterized protein n=1 Tax=Vairimorpha necatrix TaxID=6039 RepID=A0AAX4JFL7_9MICR
MQEDNLIDDKLFKTIKEIGNIIAEKDVITDDDTGIREKRIDLFYILGEMVTLYRDALKIYSEKITEKVIKTAALYTDLSYINIYEYEKGLIEKKKLIIKECDIDASEQKKNMEELKGRLKKKINKS